MSIKENINIRRNQQNIVNTMISIYKRKNNKCVVLVTGEPGVGKSAIVDILCNELINQGAKKVNIVDTHLPTDPGDFFWTLYYRVWPKKMNL